MKCGPVLSPEQRAQLHAAESLFALAQIMRARRLCAGDAVHDIVWSADGRSVGATVRGGPNYRVSLVFRNGIAGTGCTCPHRGACKHAAALVLTLLQEAPAADLGAHGQGPLSAHVHEATGGLSAGKCRKLLEHAERWMAAGDGRVNAEEFFRAFGRAFYLGHYNEEVVIFPPEHRPSTPAGFLAWLSVEAARRHLTLPDAVERAVDPDLAENCRALLAEREAVRKWKLSLARWTELSASPDAIPEFRLRLEAHGASVEMRSGGAGEFVKATRTAVEQAVRVLRQGGAAWFGQGSAAVTGVATDDYGNFRGLHGHRAAFTRQFERKDDPLARSRLAARTRPFLLRRTKNEVARDLPERIEEDLFVELEGRQGDLYRAELKRARAHLLKIKTSGQLDKLRFNILTSLLRLRQICCHPRLVGLGDKEPGHGDAATDSVKVSALLETLEPLVEEGQKVLVFSQFVGLLEILQNETAARSWKHFVLTGDTGDRGALVAEFQNHAGPAVFFISLKAGGTGLNLTAASYVVLFDPWWNPAVEAQAIDRTHRIGQKKTVFAYRLIVKNSIEEKIRALQKHKGRLAQDILGEENFVRALTLDDFRFLLGGEEEASTPRSSGRKNVPARRKPAPAAR